MKINLFYATSKDKEYNQSGTPLGLAYLAGSLQASGFDNVEIAVDEDYVIKTRPDFVGISSYSGTYTRSIQVAHKIKQSLDIPIIIGGTHISTLPESLHPIFDVGVIGEGEFVFPELLKAFDSNQWNFEHLSQIPGLVLFDKNAQIHKTLPRQLEMELDKIPKPRRDILTPYWPTLKKRIEWPQVLFTARGCPYRCMFCIHSGARQKIRYHTPERVIAEIYEILSQNPKQQTISIFDDLFAIHKRRLEEIVKLIRAEKLHHRVSFISHAKSSCFDEDIARLLKLMNSSMVLFGFESGSDRIVKYLKDPRSSVAKNQQAIDICQKYNLNVGGYFIIGSPQETYQELAQTYWFIRKNNPPLRTSGAFFLTPLPGTVYWEQALNDGRVSNQMEDWGILDFTDMQQWSQQVFVNEHYSFEQLEFADSKFEELRQINYRTLLLEVWDRIQANYRHQLYNNICSLLRENTSIFEISKDVDNFSYFLQEHKPDHTWKVEDVVWSDFEGLPTESNIIFLNHVLELCSEPQRLIEKCSSAEYLIIAVTNMANYSHVIQLLKGEFSSWNSLAIDGHAASFSSQSIQNLLNKVNYKVLNFQYINSENQDIASDIDKVLNLFQSFHIRPKSSEHLNAFSFIIVAQKQ